MLQFKKELHRRFGINPEPQTLNPEPLTNLSRMLGASGLQRAVCELLRATLVANLDTCFL